MKLVRTGKRREIIGYLHTAGLLVVAFLSLTLATPKIPILKKAGFIAIGMAAFVFMDFVSFSTSKGIVF